MRLHLGAGLAPDGVMFVFGNIWLVIPLALNVEAGRRALENEIGHQGNVTALRRQTLIWRKVGESRGPTACWSRLPGSRPVSFRAAAHGRAADISALKAVDRLRLRCHTMRERPRSLGGQKISQLLILFGAQSGCYIPPNPRGGTVLYSSALAHAKAAGVIRRLSPLRFVAWRCAASSGART